MNVTFHALGSFAAAAVLSTAAGDFARSATIKKYVAGFVIGILIHGALDFAPHHYPISSRLDVILALVLLLLTYLLVTQPNRLLLIACLAGAIFPDVVDLGPAIAAKHLGLPVPSLPFKIFPWHWKEFSGSIYDGSRRLESNVCHLLVFSISFILILANRKKFFVFWRTG